MVTATHNIESEEAGLNERLKHLKLHTHFDASGQEPLSFLASVAETTGRAEETPSGAPTARTSNVCGRPRGNIRDKQPSLLPQLWT